MSVGCSLMKRKFAALLVVVDTLGQSKSLEREGEGEGQGQGEGVGVGVEGRC